MVQLPRLSVRHAFTELLHLGHSGFPVPSFLARGGSEEEFFPELGARLFPFLPVCCGAWTHHSLPVLR